MTSINSTFFLSDGNPGKVGDYFSTICFECFQFKKKYLMKHSMKVREAAW